MPPRHAYWTILIDDQPTAFRAHDPEELLPTLNRLREKNESAVMKWFERGQLFDSRDAARDAGLGKGERRWEGPRPERRDDDPRAEARGGDRPRDKNWRPGGEHQDPRQKYKDAKKAKWTRFKEKIRERHEQRVARDPESFTPPHGDKLRGPQDRAPHDRPDDRRRQGGGGWNRQDEDRPAFDDRARNRARDDRRGDDRYDDRRPVRRDDDRRGGDRQRDWRDDREAPRASRPAFDDRDGRPSRPHGDKFRNQRPKPAWSRDEDDRRPSRPREDRFRSRDREGSDWRDRPPRWDAPRDDQRGGWKPKGGGGGRKPWGTKPGGSRPGGSRPAGGSRPPSGSRPQGGSRPAGGSSRKPGGFSRPPSGGFRDRDSDRPARAPRSGDRFENRKPRGPRRRDDDE